MAVDATWIDRVLGTDAIAEREQLDVEGVAIDLPTARTRSARDWQRRVVDDMLPDSPNADAPEKIAFEILNKLTQASRTERTVSEAFADERSLAPLKPLFVFTTRGMADVPVAFHVLAVKAADKSIKSRAFSDRTFRLLMRNAEGELDETLMRRFIEQFRARPSTLDLAQQTALDELQPGWDPDSDHLVSIQPQAKVVPFVPRAGELLRRDLRRMLDASLPRADVFRYANRLLVLHFGLYVARLAAHLNPAMDALRSEVRSPDSVSFDEVVLIESGEHAEHRFEGSLTVQAPAGSGHRRMSKRSPAVRSYEAVQRRLAELHFNLMLTHRVRELVVSYLTRKTGVGGQGAQELSRKPSSIVQRLQEQPAFRSYFERSTEALAVRFVLNQLGSASHEDAFNEIRRASSGLDALYDLYVRYNREAATKPANTRAYKQGGQVIRRLLGSGEAGLVHTRPGVGTYFEIGPGLVPMLLLTTMGPSTEKLPVHRFWDEVAAYGLHLPAEEREALLGRLKAMGLYERYSDAGAASYVRNLITGAEEVA